MFIRKIKSAKGRTYIQVVDKSSGSYNVLKSFVSASNDSQLTALQLQAQQWINKYTGKQEIDFSNSDTLIDELFDSITSLKRVGYDLLLGGIFDQIGFSKIQDPIFRELVLARVAFPKSKLKTTEYLFRYKML